MKIDCCLITTNVQNRLTLVENTVNSIDKFDDRFSGKIMSVDLFDGGVNLNWFSRFTASGWKIVSKSKDSEKSMILNQRNAVSHAQSEVILYCEDDILLNYIPKPETIGKLFESPAVNSKKTGFVSFNNHVWWQRSGLNPEIAVSFIRNLNNYFTLDGDTFLIKSEPIRDTYYLNFPVSLTTKQLFLELQEHALKNVHGIGVESGMTQAWFDLGKDREYEVLVPNRKP